MILTINTNNCNIVDNLSNNIKQLTIGEWFNLPLNNIPSSTKNNYKYKYLIPCDLVRR